MAGLFKNGLSMEDLVQQQYLEPDEQQSDEEVGREGVLLFL